MQIDPRTLGQLIKLQNSNQVDMQGTSIQQTLDSQGDSLFDILLQEMLVSEGRTSPLHEQDLVTGSFDRLAGTSDDLLWQVIQNNLDTNTDFFEISPSDRTANINIDHNIDDLIAQASQNYGVPSSLIKAVIETESSFNTEAVSSSGAKGLMQLMDGTAQGLGVSDPFDPAQNIDGGTRYLSYQLQRFGGEEKTALAAYNAGPGRLQKLGITNDEQLIEKLHLLPQETQNYIVKIANARSRYEVS